MPFATFSDEVAVFESEEPYVNISAIKVVDKPCAYGNIAWSGDASRLVVTPSSNSLPVYILENNHLSAHKQVCVNNVTSAIFRNPASREIIIGLDTGEIHLWNLRDRKISETIVTRWKHSVNFLTCNNEDTYIASGSLSSNNIGLHSLKMNKFTGRFELPEGERTSCLRFCSHKKNFLAASSSASSILVWDINKHESVFKLKNAHRGACSGIEFSPLNSSILVTVSLSQQLKMYDLRTNEVALDVNLKEPLHCIDMFQTGNRGAIGTSSGTVIIFDFNSKKVVETVKAHNSAVNAIAIHKLDEGKKLDDVIIDSPDTPVVSNRTLDLSVIDVFSPVIKETNRKSLSLNMSTPSSSIRRSSVQPMDDSFLSKMISPRKSHMKMSSPIIHLSSLNDKSVTGTPNGALLPVLEEGPFETPPSEGETKITEIDLDKLKEEFVKMQNEQDRRFKLLSEQISAMENEFTKKRQSDYETITESVISIKKSVEASVFDMKYDLITQGMFSTECFNKLMRKTDNIELILQQLVQKLTALENIYHLQN